MVEYVDDLNALLKTWRSYRDVIVFPVGGEGNRFLDFMRYTDRLGRVLCVATPAGSNKQYFDHNLPVMRLPNLTLFKRNALFVVAAAPLKHDEILEVLTKFGCKNIVCLNDDVNKKIKAQLNEMATSGQITLWTSKNLLARMDRMEYAVADQNEISYVHTKSFAEYRNCFRDREVVVIATGPTLQYYKPIPGAIHIGVNFAWRREDIPIDFLFAQDFGAGRHVIVEGFDKIKEAIFLGKYLDTGASNYIHSPMRFELLSDKVRRYYPTSNPSVGQPIYQDIRHHGLADFWTVAMPALHFALFTYPKRIYLAGCDTSVAGHFYDADKLPKNDFTSKMKLGYSRMKAFARKNYIDTEIISINPIGLKGLFKDIYTDEYKASLEKTSAVEETPIVEGTSIVEETLDAVEIP